MEATCAGTKVYFERTGRRDAAKRVVLLHGWGCSSDLMRSVAQALEGNLDVLSLDFPGFGQSGRSPEPWGVEEYAACVMDLLRQQDFLPCSVVAHSFGARVAIVLASGHPERFERMILTGAAGIRKELSQEGRQRQEAFKKQKALAQSLKKLKFLAPLAEKIEEKAREKYGSRDYNALDEEMRRTFVRVISLDLTDRLAQIACPTLLIWGDQDTETPLEMGQKMEKLIPDAALVVFPGCSHFAYLEQSARFGAIAQTFFVEE